MNKPLLIVVTGRPAAGKSTLAGILAKELNYPLLSRDELMEGYVHTVGIQDRQSDNSAALHIYHTFFDVIDLLISKGVSLLIEAAFQDRLWKSRLLPLLNKAEIKIIICEIGPDLAKVRFKSRLSSDPTRDIFHGDHSVAEQGGLQTDSYEPVSIEVPMLVVDTTDHYKPGIGQIIDFVRRPLG